MIGNNSENNIYSPDSFRYRGIYYERDVYTNRYYRHEKSRNPRPDTNGALVKRRVSYEAYREAYKNCSSETYDYVEEALCPELSAYLIGLENRTEVAA
jgi:hypothetical protein